MEPSAPDGRMGEEGSDSTGLSNSESPGHLGRMDFRDWREVPVKGASYPIQNVTMSLEHQTASLDHKQRLTSGLVEFTKKMFWKERSFLSGQTAVQGARWTLERRDRCDGKTRPMSLGQAISGWAVGSGFTRQARLQLLCVWGCRCSRSSQSP